MAEDSTEAVITRTHRHCQVFVPLSKPKYYFALCGSIIYAILSVFLLSRLSPRWTTAHYLIFYAFLSFVYFFSISRLFKFPFDRILPRGALFVILFSLIFSLIRLSDQLIGYFFSFDVQKIYYFIFFVTLLYFSFYYFIKTLFPIFFERGSGISVWLQSQRPIGMTFLQRFWKGKRFILFIFLFGLAVRTLFAVQLTIHLPPGVMGGPDSQYNEDAVYLAQTGNILDATRPFLSQKGSVVLFYAAIYKIFGYYPLIARLFNALLGAICILFTYAIARFIFDETAAKIAAILTAGYGFLIQYGGYIGSEAFGLFTLELFLLALFIAMKRKDILSQIAAFISGLGLTLLVMARPEYYYSLFLIFPWVVFLWRKSKMKILFFSFGFMILALPWMYRNFLTFGDFTFSTIVSAVDSTPQSLLHQTWFYEFKKFQAAGIPVNDFKQMLAQIFHHPLLTLKIIWPHLGSQIARFWDYDIFFTPAFIFLQPKSSAYNMVLCFYLYCFMVAGIFLTRKEWSYSILLLFLILFKTISYVLTTSSTMYEPIEGTFTQDFKDWYRFTIIPLTHILMGGGIAYFFSRLRMGLSWKTF